MTRKALYTGSFDPMTNGHLDIITRASKMFDELVVGVIVNPNKHPLFSKEERVSMIEEVTSHLSNVRVDSFEGLLADYVNRNHFDAVVRGLRATSDFEYEISMEVTGTMILPCAVTLKPVEYPFQLKIEGNLEQILQEIDENAKKIENSIDILPIIWENILMEIPMRVVSKEAEEVHLEGDGWKLVTDKDSVKETNPALAKLKDLL